MGIQEKKDDRHLQPFIQILHQLICAASCYNPDAMQQYGWRVIPVEFLNPLVSRQVLHGDTVTLARLTMKSGAVVARHSHPNEQITTVESGRLRFVFDEGSAEVGTGECLQIPSGVPHAVTALEDSVALDVFCPVREDWIRGEDAYLRHTQVSANDDNAKG